MMTSCYNVGQLRPLALCIQGLPLGYRSVSLLARGEVEDLIYATRSNLKGVKQAASASWWLAITAEKRTQGRKPVLSVVEGAKPFGLLHHVT
jgi:hypothetical protein